MHLLLNAALMVFFFFLLQAESVISFSKSKVETWTHLDEKHVATLLLTSQIILFLESRGFCTELKYGFAFGVVQFEHFIF